MFKHERSVTMEKPQALKVIGIILIVLGIIRLLGGVIGIFAYLKMDMENINLLIVIFLENFVCTIIFIISGILLLKGKKTGRPLFVAASVVPFAAYAIFLREYSKGFSIMVILILILYFWPSIKEYFKNSKEQ